LEKARLIEVQDEHVVELVWTTLNAASAGIARGKAMATADTVSKRAMRTGFQRRDSFF
jgi:hypothetical protein